MSRRIGRRRPRDGRPLSVLAVPEPVCLSGRETAGTKLSSEGSEVFGEGVQDAAFPGCAVLQGEGWSERVASHRERTHHAIGREDRGREERPC